LPDVAYKGVAQEYMQKDHETQLVLESLVWRENKEWSLKGEIWKIHEHFYENNLEDTKIDKHGVNDFIQKNYDFNE
jgi:hypothetical protein